VNEYEILLRLKVVAIVQKYSFQLFSEAKTTTAGWNILTPFHESRHVNVYLLHVTGYLFKTP